MQILSGPRGIFAKEKQNVNRQVTVFWQGVPQKVEVPAPFDRPYRMP